MSPDLLTGLTDRVHDAILSYLDVADLFALSGVSQSWRRVILTERTWTGRGRGAAWRRLAAQPHVAAMVQVITARNMMQRAVAPACVARAVTFARCLPDGRLLLQPDKGTDAIQLLDTDMRVLRDMPVPSAVVQITVAPLGDRVALFTLAPSRLDLLCLDVRAWSLTSLVRGAHGCHGTWPCRELFSPDGRLCAVFKAATDQSDREAVCVRTEPPSGFHVHLGFTEALAGRLNAAWSPDSAQVAVCCTPGGGPVSVRCIDARTGAAHAQSLEFHCSHYSCHVSWDPHSRRVMVLASGHLFIVHCRGQSPVIRCCQTYIISPAWDPAGHWAWLQNRDGFHKVDADTGDVRLTHTWAAYPMVRWASDASYIVHGGTDDDTQGLWVTSFRGERRSTIKYSEDHNSGWLVSPDRETAVVIHRAGGVSIYDLDPHVDPSLRLQNHTSTWKNATWCPDSTHVAFTAIDGPHRYGSRSLHVMNTRTGDCRRLCELTPYAKARLEWAAQGGVLTAIDTSLGECRLTLLDFSPPPLESP